MDETKEALRVDEAALVGVLMIGAKSPLTTVGTGNGTQALRDTALNLERAAACYRQALAAMAQMEEAHRGGPAREWRKAAQAARERQWGYAAMMLEQAALMIATGLGPDPVSDDEVGTGLDDVTRAAVAWLCNRGLKRLRRSVVGVR